MLRVKEFIGKLIVLKCDLAATPNNILSYKVPTIDQLFNEFLLWYTQVNATVAVKLGQSADLGAALRLW